MLRLVVGRKIQAALGSGAGDKNHRQAYACLKSLCYISLYICIVHGADPNTNPRLAALVAIAKKSGLPKTTLEGAIAGAAGKSLSGVSLEAVSIEAMMPSSVAAIIECQTDNKLRTLSDIRYIIKDFGGTVTPTNHLFERLGQIKLKRAEDVREEDMFDQAIECGATDVEVAEDGNLVIYTEPQQTVSVAETLAKMTKLQVTSSDIIWLPKAETKVENTLDGALDEFVGMSILTLILVKS